MTTIEVSAEAKFEYKPWFRYGHGRVYVERGGVKLGYFDYDGRDTHPEAHEHLEALTEAASSWVPKSEQRKAKAARKSVEAVAAPVAEPAPGPSEPEQLQKASVSAEGPVPEPAPEVPAVVETGPAPSPSVPTIPDLDLAGVQAGERTQAKADELKADIAG
ncbi:hypothetical protein LG293_17740 (plasmid) [Citricoccus nitrophenolicus]